MLQSSRSPGCPHRPAHRGQLIPVVYVTSPVSPTEVDLHLMQAELEPDRQALPR